MHIEESPELEAKIISKQLKASSLAKEGKKASNILHLLNDQKQISGGNNKGIHNRLSNNIRVGKEKKLSTAEQIGAKSHAYELSKIGDNSDPSKANNNNKKLKTRNVPKIDKSEV